MSSFNLSGFGGKKTQQAIGNLKTAFEIKSGWVLYFDGSIQKNPGGPGAGGWVLKFGDKEIRSGFVGIPETPTLTVNDTEYLALAHGLAGVLSLGEEVPILLENMTSLIVAGDSQLVIYQCVGEYACNVPRLATHMQVVKDMCTRLMDVHSISVGFAWIPRTMNEDADSLAKKAYV